MFGGARLPALHDVARSRSHSSLELLLRHDLQAAGLRRLQWLAVGGCRAARRRGDLAAAFEKTAILSWLVIPLALMSIGTSKLHHYVYPFLPPLALAMGFGPAWLSTQTRSYRRCRAHAGGPRGVLPRGGALEPACGPHFSSLAAICVSLGDRHAPARNGRRSRWGGHDIFRNSHVARPLVLALRPRDARRPRRRWRRSVLVPAVLFVSLMPIASYGDALTLHAAGTTSAAHGARLPAGASAAPSWPLAATAPGIYAVGEAGWFLHSYYLLFP